MKETCLSGQAYELVRNLETTEEVLERLEKGYGEVLEVVDAVINKISDANIKGMDQDKGIIQLIDVLEKGVNDLTANKKRFEIAYTVKLIEQKLSWRVMFQWFEEEEKAGEGNHKIEWKLVPPDSQHENDLSESMI